MTETRKELIDKFSYLVDEEAIGNINFNDWEARFLLSIESNLVADDGYLTDLQIEKLEQIYEKYNK